MPCTISIPDIPGRIESIREHLIEARRWVRTNPDAAREGVHVAIYLMGSLLSKPEFSCRVGRLVGNLAVGLDSILACPDVIIGYIDGSLWELSSMASEIRKDRERQGAGEMSS